MTVTDFGFPAEEEGGRRRGEGGGGALRDIYRVLLSLIVSYFFRLSPLFSFFSAPLPAPEVGLHVKFKLLLEIKKKNNVFYSWVLSVCCNSLLCEGVGRERGKGRGPVMDWSNGANELSFTF